MRHALMAALLASLAALGSDARANPIVRFTTTLGAFEVELCAETSPVCAGAAPITVANFLRYVDEGRYPETSFVHRVGRHLPSPPVVQGGGYWIDPAGPSIRSIAALPPIPLEVGTGLSNTRGTIAMARGTALDSATSQWFLNLVDNVSLDTAAGGYAVFGQVLSGLDVVDAIGALPIWNFGVPFTEAPLIDYPGAGAAVVPYLVYVADVSRVPEPGTVALVSLGLAALSRKRNAVAL